MKKATLFISIDGEAPFAETYDLEVEAVSAAVDIKAHDEELCLMLGIDPATSITAVLYLGDPMKHETLEFVKEV